MTSVLSLELPTARRGDSAWLESVPPTVLADLLDGLRVMYYAAASPDVQRMMMEHATQLQQLGAQHASRVDTLTHSLDAERAITRAHVELERSLRRQEIQQLVHDELAVRQVVAPPAPLPPTASCEEALREACRAHYEARQRLPRNLGDVLHELPHELLGDIARQPSLFDSTIARMKREHYRGSKRTRPEEDASTEA